MPVKTEITMCHLNRICRYTALYSPPICPLVPPSTVCRAANNQTVFPNEILPWKFKIFEHVVKVYFLKILPHVSSSSFTCKSQWEHELAVVTHLRPIPRAGSLEVVRRLQSETPPQISIALAMSRAAGCRALCLDFQYCPPSKKTRQSSSLDQLDANPTWIRHDPRRHKSINSHQAAATLMLISEHVLRNFPRSKPISNVANIDHKLRCDIESRALMG